MNWEALAAVGQLASALGVVVTLAYLARQIGVANRAAADANRLERSRGVREMFLAAATHADLRATIGKTMGGGGNLATRLGVNEDEAHQVFLVSAYWWYLHWGQWASSKSQADVDELSTMVREFYTSPMMRIIWETPGATRALDQGFVRFVNDCLASAPMPDHP
jgi:hypothetical protein